jgi:glycerol-1-phosphatase
VTAEGGGFCCQGWTARWGDDGPQLDRGAHDGPGERLDGLRALCAAAWSAGAVTRKAADAAVRLLKLE